MKQAFVFCSCFLSIMLCGTAAADDVTKLSGPYLGQKPPGMTPEIFASGIISTEASEGSFGFALDGTAFLFQRFVDRDCHTYVMTRTGGQWGPAELIPFWKELVHNGDFVIAPDDRTILYQVKQERSGQLESNVWAVKLEGEGWGSRSALPAPINTAYDESYASRAANGNLYFFSNRPGGKGQFDLYMAEFKHGGYQALMDGACFFAISTICVTPVTSGVRCQN